MLFFRTSKSIGIKSWAAASAAAHDFILIKAKSLCRFGKGFYTV